MVRQSSNSLDLRDAKRHPCPMFNRYAIYTTFPTGPLADRLAHWLGWDSEAGTSCMPPDLPGLPRPTEAITERPRKYGAHGTIKPPFRLTETESAEALSEALRAFCEARAPVILDGLRIARLGRFLALIPTGNTSGLADLAGDAVRALDRFRAAPTETELARRRKARLSSRQDNNLQRWGYPYVFEDFRFHITLTGPLPQHDLDATETVLAHHFAPLLPRPFVIDHLSLLGEDAITGRFHLIERIPLSA